MSMQMTEDGAFLPGSKRFVQIRLRNLLRKYVQFGVYIKCARRLPAGPASSHRF